MSSQNFVWCFCVIFAILVASEEAKDSFFFNQWCHTKSFKMKVKMKGCKTRKIEAKYCYGQCNSFYLPGSLKDIRAVNEIPSVHCTTCAPVKVATEMIPLDCKTNRGKRKIKYRKVYIFDRCKCKEKSCAKLYPSWFRK